MVYIIIVLAILLLFEGVYATLLSSQIRKLELLNMNYSSKIIESETQKDIDEDKIDELINYWLDNAYCDEGMELERKAAEYGCKIGYRKALGYD